ncbi:MAG TPA: HAD family phosphatase, partial [Bacteroidales bacterium]|nr:HAD family phosphatase [Bacteroidales bacterium]
MIQLPHNCKALVFDMDGTMIHNKDYHDAAWIEFCNRHSVTIDLDSFCKAYTGKTNEVILQMIFGKKMPKQQILEYETEKEQIYRDLYSPHFMLVSGLQTVLEKAKQKNFLIAIGTSAPVVNVDFVLSHGRIRHFFDVIVHSEMVTHGKPSPEIYLKVAELLQIQPEQCVCFEDSIAGISSATSAGMYTIGIATELSIADLLKAG